MSSSNRHGLNVTKSISLLNKSIKFNFKDFFKAITRGDAVDALTSVFTFSLSRST